MDVMRVQDWRVRPHAPEFADSALTDVDRRRRQAIASSPSMTARAPRKPEADRFALHQSRAGRPL
jgi:hypothetical protein